jgi:hypothetical protein
MYIYIHTYMLRLRRREALNLCDALVLRIKSITYVQVKTEGGAQLVYIAQD